MWVALKAAPSHNPLILLQIKETSSAWNPLSKWAAAQKVWVETYVECQRSLKAQPFNSTCSEKCSFFTPHYDSWTTVWEKMVGGPRMLFPSFPKFPRTPQGGQSRHGVFAISGSIQSQTGCCKAPPVKIPFDKINSCSDGPSHHVYGGVWESKLSLDCNQSCLSRSCWNYNESST